MALALRQARRGAAAAAVAAAGMLATPPMAAAQVPAGAAAWERSWIVASDGTRLHADVFRPSGVGRDRTPVLVDLGPYFGDFLGSAPATQRPVMRPNIRRRTEMGLARGYTVVNVSVRGFGDSGGCSDLGGPKEQADAVTVVEWAGTQPWSTGRVGMIGFSYDAWAQVMALAGRPAHLAAAVIEHGQIDPYRAVYMNGNRYIPGGAPGTDAETTDGVTVFGYQGSSLLPPPAGGGAESVRQAVTAAEDPLCPGLVTGQALAGGRNSQFWRERNLIPRAAGSEVPVFWRHGFADMNVRPDQFAEVWTSLRGPRRAWFGHTRHVVGDDVAGVGRDGFFKEAFDFLDLHVAQRPGAAAKVAAEPRVVVQDGATGAWRAEAAWPPADVRPVAMPLRVGSYHDAPGNKGESGPPPAGMCTEVDRRCNPASTPGNGSWTFSRPMAAEAHIAGIPRVRLTRLALAPGVNLVALLYDVAPDGQASLIARGASASGAPALELDLYPTDWRVRAGHRLGLLLSGSDDFFFSPGTTATRVRVTGGTVTLPLVAVRREATLDGGPSRAIRARTTFPVPAATIAQHEVAWPAR